MHDAILCHYLEWARLMSLGVLLIHSATSQKYGNNCPHKYISFRVLLGLVLLDLNESKLVEMVRDQNSRPPDTLLTN